jgi:hypothetical protein
MLGRRKIKRTIKGPPAVVLARQLAVNMRGWMTKVKGYRSESVRASKALASVANALPRGSQERSDLFAAVASVDLVVQRLSVAIREMEDSISDLEGF